jgi:hypothetical protein
MRRPVTAADGTEDFARFTIARVAHGTMPEGRAQFLTHHTEALVWPAAMLDHPNGAQALSALWIAADDPAEAAERFARFTGRAAGRNGAVMTLALDRGHLRFAAPSWVEERLGIDVPGSLPSIVAAEVASAGLRETETLLRATGFSVRAHDCGLTVNLPPALGGALIFSGADTEGGR